MRTAMLGTLMVASALVMLSLGVVAQQTITVPDDYPTIQAAIDAAEPGDTVYVRAGTYVENLTITKPLRLVGEDRLDVWIRAADPRRPALEAHLIKGTLRVEGLALIDGMAGLAFHVEAGASVSIADALLAENQFGVYAVGGGSVTVEHSFLVDNTIGFSTSAGTAKLKLVEISRGTIGVLLDGNGTTAIYNVTRDLLEAVSWVARVEPVDGEGEQI